MEPISTSTTRRNFLRVVAGTAATLGLAACGTSGPGAAGATNDGTAGATTGAATTGAATTGGATTGGTAAGTTAAGGTATYWTLTGPPGEQIRRDTVKRFGAANPGSSVKIDTFQNDAYKAKLKTALGAGQGPTIIWGWGGGGLKSWVDADQVEDLTSWFGENAAVKDRLFPSSFGAATVGGKIYAMPCETVQPIVLFYNKKVFDKVGVEPPKSWGDIMTLVPKFNDAGIAPFSLGGQSRWTNMMWLEFLFDRIGGSEVFQAVFDGEKDAWSNPDAIKALTEMQNLIKADGFVKGFSSITADSNADLALLYTSRAAMMLHGSWTYGRMVADGNGFVQGGNLGYMNFPPVEGGKGDPSSTVGNPGQYLSISSKASDSEKAVAKSFFSTAVLSDAEVKQWIDGGAVPIVKGSDAQLASAKDPEWLKFLYGVSSGAKTFAQSWDQALSPTAAETLLDNIAKLFQLSVTPEQFATNLNQVIGK